jgi:hypothetical protein
MIKIKTIGKAKIKLFIFFLSKPNNLIKKKFKNKNKFFIKELLT